MSGLFGSFNISASGMTAQRTRLDVISNNIANAQTTRRSDGQPGPYRRQAVIFEPRENQLHIAVPFVRGLDRKWNQIGEGVRITEIKEDESPLIPRYEPGHPDADEEGYVYYPNVNIVTEMVDMIGASRAYEANVSAIRDQRQMFTEALRIAG